MEAKRYPITQEERKLQASVRELIALLEKAKGSLRMKQQNNDAQNLSKIQMLLMRVHVDIGNEELELLNRQYSVYLDIKESNFEQQTKSMPREHRAKIDSVFELLKAYVSPVASKFQ
jgi:hypothetical protein